ncbi:hypothetical protein AAC387_Pa03g4347 [Persea americana]
MSSSISSIVSHDRVRRHSIRVADVLGNTLDTLLAVNDTEQLLLPQSDPVNHGIKQGVTRQVERHVVDSPSSYQNLCDPCSAQMLHVIEYSDVSCLAPSHDISWFFLSKCGL